MEDHTGIARGIKQGKTATDQADLGIEGLYRPDKEN